MGSCPAARRGARQRAGLTPASASNTLSCQLEMLHSKQLRSIKMLVDSDHGIYRVRTLWALLVAFSVLTISVATGEQRTWSRPPAGRSRSRMTHTGHRGPILL